MLDIYRCSQAKAAAQAAQAAQAATAGKIQSTTIYQSH